MRKNVYKKKNPNPTNSRIWIFGRSVGIRTRGLLDPNQARYQTSPHPDNEKHYIEKTVHCQVMEQKF